MDPTVIVRSYRPMGVAVTVHSESQAMLDAIEAGLARYPAMGVAGSLHLDVVVRDDLDGDPGWPSVRPVDGPDRLHIRIGASTAVLDHRRSTARITLSRSLCDLPDALRLLAESVFTAAAVRTGELHAVHSALVVHQGVGLVLRGQSGAGKSTLTYGCLRSGMTVCSDDWIYAAAHQPAGCFAGYPWRMLMTEDAATRFPELAGAATVPHPAAEGRKVPVHPPSAQQAVTAEAAAVVLLDPSPVLALRPLDPMEAAERFWAPALPTERDHLSTAWVAQLLDRPVYLLQRGSDPMTAVQALAELAESLR